MYWSGQNPIGRRLATSGKTAGPSGARSWALSRAPVTSGPEAPQKAEIYVPVAQAPVPYMTLVVRTQGDPMALISAVRGQLAAIDPEQSAFWFQTMEDLVARSTARRQFQTALVTMFAVLALLLAGIGVYGVMGYMVAQRRREIGVRLALGAKPRDVVAMVLGNGLWLTLAGVVAGMAARSRFPACWRGSSTAYRRWIRRPTRGPWRSWWRLRHSRHTGRAERQRARIRSWCCATNEWRRHSTRSRRPGIERQPRSRRRVADRVLQKA